MQDIDQRVERILSNNDHALLRKMVRNISEFKLPNRVKNSLEIQEYSYVGDIAIKDEAKLLVFPNFGRISLRDVRENILDPLELKTGMGIPGWPDIDDPLRLIIIERVSAVLHQEALAPAQSTATAPARPATFDPFTPLGRLRIMGLKRLMGSTFKLPHI